jgi:hypothetical protein
MNDLGIPADKRVAGLLLRRPESQKVFERFCAIAFNIKMIRSAKIAFSQCAAGLCKNAIFALLRTNIVSLFEPQPELVTYTTACHSSKNDRNSCTRRQFSIFNSFNGRVFFSVA